MNTPNTENDSGSGQAAPEKWLEKIATLQAEKRALNAKLSVARNQLANTEQEAIKWDLSGQPCWCAMPDGGDEVYTAHSVACAQLRRLSRALAEQLAEVAP